MNNVIELPNHESSDLVASIKAAIANDCNRQVSKRLALKLALALIDNPGEAEIYFAQVLAQILKRRLDEEVRVTTVQL